MNTEEETSLTTQELHVGRASLIRHARSSTSHWSDGLAVVLLISVLGGCGTFPPGTTEEVIDGNRSSSSIGVAGKTSGEPNGSFADAIIAIFDDAGVARLEGTVEAVGDLDVFSLGPLTAGDRLIVDAVAGGSGFGLDVSVAVFDAQQRLLYSNDDRDDSILRTLDSYIEWIVRHDSDTSYLVVTHSAFAASGAYTGTYRVDVKITPGFSVPDPVEQVLLLNFDGGYVTITGRSPMTLQQFDAASISPVYDGETDTIKATIKAVFEQNFERFDVTIFTTDDPPPPDEVQVSTVHFGGYDSGAFGIADDVDMYNVDYCDDAIIFTESFELYVFSRTPTPTELGIAIGNVGSHEAGHLLGLNHVDDDDALMDDQSHADAFIEDQEFMEAPLSSDIMPIGLQDAVLLLNEIVGPAPEPD